MISRETSNRKTCERCGELFEPTDERDWYCAECVAEILNGIRGRPAKPKE